MRSLKMRIIKKHTIQLVMLTLLTITFAGCDEQRELTEGETIRFFQTGETFRVGPAGFNSTFSFYNVSPESPDGKLISYVKIISEQLTRNTPLDGELWVCTTNLSDARMVAELTNFQVHNGVNAQWVDNNTIAYYSDGKVHVKNIDGQDVISPIEAFSLGHTPLNNKILYSAVAPDTNLYTMYELDLSSNQSRIIADASAMSEISELFFVDELRDMDDWRIRHLKYSPDGSKVAFRMDIGDGEINNHLVTMAIDGSDIKYFGPKPMHFQWFDNETIMGHDNQINDGMPDDRSARRWTREAELVETLTGEGNHLAAREDREVFATESWYNEYPVILRAYKRGQTSAFWEETVSADNVTVWELGNHVNPSFSRDGRRVYFHKNEAPGVSQAFMVVLPEN